MESKKHKKIKIIKKKVTELFYYEVGSREKSVGKIKKHKFPAAK